jgi:hypothetical protein
MGAPWIWILGGILVAPFVRYLFLALVILIAVRFVVGCLGLRSMFATPPLAEAPCTVRLHPRLSHSILDLSDCRGVLNCCELRFAKM